MTVAPREGERCAECGTPLEPLEDPAAADDASADPGALPVVFRCANGHLMKVNRHESPRDEPSGRG